MLDDILWRNQGQILTPELILGILKGSEYVPANYLDLAQFAPMELNGCVFAAERFADALPELREMHQAHYAETEKYRAGIPLIPDYDDYGARDRAGSLLQFTIRKDGELVGQCLMKFHRSTQTQTLAASEDALYFKPGIRGGLSFFRAFVRWMEAQVQVLGVREVTLTSKSVNAADKLMMRCGYLPVATQLTKVFGEPTCD